MNTYKMLDLVEYLLAVIEEQKSFHRNELETEEKSNVIFYKQGELVGLKNLSSAIRDNFPTLIEPASLDYVPMSEIADSVLEEFLQFVHDFEIGAGDSCEQWTAALKTLENRREEIKDELLIEVENMHGLFLRKGENEGMNFYRRCFAALGAEQANRSNAAKKREEELPFGETSGDNGGAAFYASQRAIDQEIIDGENAKEQLRRKGIMKAATSRRNLKGAKEARR
jgi:hypothetical protein